MARLNDPPAPPESVDALKRRFIRQNREIARVNSTQSLRIRNLEAEISRLLAENISLREQAINSSQEAERWRSSHKLIKEVGSLKEKLESRLSEVNALVTELGTLPEEAARRSSYRKRSGLVETVKSPDQKEWRTRQKIGGVIAGERELQEGRLPAIQEDKYYPRKTLEGHEIQRLAEGEVEPSDSPDLGPPPVAHFDVPDPIKFDTQPAIAEDHALSTEEEEVMVNNTNLETRRKRRPSALLENMSGLQKRSTNSGGEESDTVLKPGSKRKLDVRDDGHDISSMPKANDDFTFQRKSVSSSTPLPRSKGSRFVRPITKPVAQPPQEEPNASQEKNDPPARKVLAPKSTNSPTKIRRTNINDKIGAPKEDVSSQFRARATRQDRRQSIAPLTAAPGPTEEAAGEPEAVLQGTGLPPKTPASLDLFSPASTEPSVKTNTQPTEMAITASVEDVLGNAGRGSRRARAAVSYAEPNLRDKMRRPGKELVTAVEGIDHFKNREASARAESVDWQADGSVVKKEKPTEDASWKNLPEAKEEAPSPLKEKATRLSDESRHTKEVHEPTVHDPATIESAISKLSIYDGPTSSPHDESKGSSSSIAESESVQPKKPTLKSRRHSVNPAGFSRLGQDIVHNKPSIERQERPSSAAGHRPESGRPGSAAGHQAEASRPSPAAELKRSASVAGDTSRPSAGADLKRSTSVVSLVERKERAASRRRSMMV